MRTGPQRLFPVAAVIAGKRVSARLSGFSAPIMCIEG